MQSGSRLVSARAGALALAALALLATGCSSGGGGGGTAANSVAGAQQDLTFYPSGLTTVVTFTGTLGGTWTPAHFEADGGQTAQTVVTAGTTATVTWDQRVTPNHQVRVVGKTGIPTTWTAVTTSDPSTPTFTAAGAQNPGLGGDVITVTFGGGPWVVEADAEDPASWSFEQGGTPLALTGCTLDLVPATQILTITTDELVNVHASFELAAVGLTTVADVSLDTTPVAGVGTGDTTSPSLLTADQNLVEDPLGAVIDFTFDEAMDPVFATQLSHFQVSAPDLAVDVEQVAGQPEVLRVTFNNPIVPGLNTVTLDGLMDAHGNVLTGDPVVTAITSSGAVPAEYDLVNTKALTVENEYGDQIIVVTTQALEPEQAVDPALWSMEWNTVTEAPSVSIIPFITEMSYDLPTATLTVDFDLDLVNGDTVDIQALGIAEIDGELFGDSIQVTAAGDATVPTAQTFVQNRSQDPTGKTVDVTFSEDVEQTSAENTANWSVSGGPSVVSATRLTGLEMVRLELDALAVPGDNTVSVSNVTDLAGNVMTPVVAAALTSTDTTPPEILSAEATAVEGSDNDTVKVRFSDDMVDSEVLDGSAWTIESPLGTTMSTAGVTISYVYATRIATLTFNGGNDQHFKRDTGFRLTLSYMRDLGGNTISITPWEGQVVSESNLPIVDTAWVDTLQASDVTVRFSEPCDYLDDIAFLSEYTVRDSGGVFKGLPSTAAATSDDMGVLLVYPFAVLTTDTVDVEGVTDLAGNPLFPALTVPVVAEDPLEVTLLDGASEPVAMAGEENDTIQVKFLTSPGSWGRLDPTNYAIWQGVDLLDLTGAEFAWYPGLSSVFIGLNHPGADDVLRGGPYTIRVQGMISQQGVLSAFYDDPTLVGLGDSTGPGLSPLRTRIDAANPATSIIVELDEAYDSDDLATLSNVQLNGSNALSLTALGPRSLRAEFAAVPAVSDVVDVDLDDLAGNNGVASTALQAPVAGGPLLSSVSGTAVSGVGGDTLTIEWSTPVQTSTALNLANYSVESPPGTPVSLTGATARYSSPSNTVTIRLADGVELQPAATTVRVSATNIANHDGVPMAPGQLNGAVGGDVTAPAFQAAFANYRADLMGMVYDVLFDEDVDSAFASSPANWSGSGGQTGYSVIQVRPDHYRVELLLPLSPGEDLVLAAGLEDPAGNQAAELTVAPTL